MLRASKLNGMKFGPWKAPPNGQTQFKPVDGPNLKLSTSQLALFERWAPANEALPPPAMAEPRPLTMYSASPLDLVQDIASDCSVVASICALSAREERGHHTVLTKILFPSDSTAGRPEISPTGVYYVRLNFNGCYRLVVIDDRLPVSKSARMLHIIDRACPSLLWPALLEKAYLTVRGGYDFPGSNSCTDLWVLTGWIPEQIILSDEDVTVQSLWKIMYNAFLKGDVLITVGTSEMSKRSQRALGLASEHSYAVIDLKEEAGQAMVRLKNPWCDGPSWKPASRGPLEDSGTSEVNLIDLDDQELSTSQSVQSPAAFWMDLSTLLQEFYSLYLNWNPNLFSHRRDAHFTWSLEPNRAAGATFVRSPQFSLRSDSEGMVWLLLCRHFEDRPESVVDEGTLSQSTKQEIRESHTKPPNPDGAGYICVYAFNNGGDRVRSNTGYIKKAHYVESAQVLLQLDMQANQSYTIAVSEQELVAGRHTFSLIAFSTQIISLDFAHNPYKESQELRSAWNLSNAGGRDELPTHLLNPQFKLSVARSTSLALLLESFQVLPGTSNQDVSVGFKVLHSNGKRVTKIANRDIVMTSGAYTKGAAHSMVEDIGPGDYTIICSTWVPGQEAKFTLRLDSADICSIEQLPSELAGRFLIDNLARPTFDHATSKMCAPLQIHRHLKLTAIAKVHSIARTTVLTGDRTPRSPIRLSVELGHGPSQHILSVSSDGEFDDSEAGIRLNDVDLWPEMRKYGDIWLVLDRLSPPADGVSESYRVDLLVDGIRGQDWTIGNWRSLD